MKTLKQLFDVLSGLRKAKCLLENLTISELTSKQEKWNFSLKKNL
jgi:hypothetical protein